MRDQRSLALRLCLAVALSCAIGGLFAVTGVGPVLAFTAVALAVVVLSFAFHALRHARLARHLLARSEKGDVAGTGVRLGTFDRAAFVAGITRPQIFCDRTLTQDLTADELRAVTLHERAHQRSRDPLRLALLAVAAPLIRRLPEGQDGLVRLAADREIAADRFALDHGATPSAIASAVLKVAPAGPVHAAAFSPAVELRMRALLGEEVSPRASLRRFGWLPAGALVGGALCMAALHPFMP
jgi:beta-lactamase regulating signal transducer with metallopeptidase domain